MTVRAKVLICENWAFFSRYWQSSLIRGPWCRPSGRRQSQADIACAHSISSDDPRPNEPGLASGPPSLATCELALETMIEYLERSLWTGTRGGDRIFWEKSVNWNSRRWYVGYFEKTEWEINRSSKRRDRCSEQKTRASKSRPHKLRLTLTLSFQMLARDDFQISFIVHELTRFSRFAFASRRSLAMTFERWMKRLDDFFSSCDVNQMIAFNFENESMSEWRN